MQMAAISHTDISIILSQTRGFEKAFSLSYLRYNAVFLDSFSVLRVYYRQNHTTEVHPMEKPRIGCVVMAAGNASRFGANKLAAQVDGKTLLRRALEAVPPACFAQVVVVTQYPEAAEAARRFSFTPVENQHPDWGISHTISLGLDALQDCDAALFLVSDQPLLRQASVAELVDLYCRTRPTSWLWATTVSAATPACSPPASFRSCGSCGGSRRQHGHPPSRGRPAAVRRARPASWRTWTPAPRWTS